VPLAGTRPSAPSWGGSFGPLLVVPAAILLVGLLAYPLGLGVWLGFKDAKIGSAGTFIGIENYQYLLDDPVFRLTVVNTALYTVVTVILKLALGLGLALVLNQKFAGVRFWRSMLLLPYVVPTVLSAFAWWWIFDPQFSFISWPLLLPLTVILTTFSAIFTFTDFQLVWTITRGGPANATHLFVTLAYQRGIAGGAMGEGAAIAGFTLPFLGILAFAALRAIRE